MINPVEIEVRFVNRRKIARWSFALLSASMILLVSLDVTSDEFTNRILVMLPIIIIATTVWTTLILGYYASASYEQGQINREP